MLKTAECFERGSSQKSKFEGFWLDVVNLVKSQPLKKEKRDIYELKPEYEDKVKRVLNKPTEELIALKNK